jgi:outer membrane lipoprotein SlyB
MKRIITILVATALLGGCVQQNLSGSAYSRNQVQQAQQIEYAVVDSVQPVIIQGRTDGVVGAGSGAIIGGIAGSTMGGGKGSSIMTVLGAVAGGMAGQAIEENATTVQGQEIVVRTDSGRLFSVVQEVQNNMMFRSGDRVRVLTTQGGTVRVSY